ncbi:MAG TPA: nuclear transport factor 2 family protein, partial [Paracoccaceae bacterium]|nr:nuclear transport factor 2 family protein [Paracoccaceae bacterium]
MNWRLMLALGALLLAPATAAQEDLSVRTAQVDDLTAVRQIKHLQARWGHMAMAGNWAGMADMATDDVVMVLPVPAVGRAALEQSLRNRQGHGVDGMPAGRLNIRLYISPVITLAPDGQSATGRWHHIAMTGEIGGEAGWIGTTDVIGYRLTAKGWKIAHIRPYLQFSGDYSSGWSHDAATLERAPYHYTPDEAGMLLPLPRTTAPRDATTLEQQARRLLAQSLAQNTVSAYGYYLDRGMVDDAADLFAADALIEQGGQGSWAGAGGVSRFLTRFGEPRLDHGELADRLQLMPMTNVASDGSMALVRNVELAMTGQHGCQGQWQVSMQTFLLRPDAAGHWRIAQMHHNPIMRADHAAGWTDPLPAALPIMPGGEPTGETRLGPVDFRDSAYGVPPLGESLFMPP